MCDINCIRWGAKSLRKEEVEGKRVLEVGSCDVNGSLRYIVELLEPAEYVGVDMSEGRGVDIVCPAENLVEFFGKESFDVIISTCTLEHIRNWKTAVSNIKNACRRNGLILLVVPSKFPFHEFPYDYWRYEKEDISNIFSDHRILSLEEDTAKMSNIYAKLQKPDSFSEKTLLDYELHSVVVNKRIIELRDHDFDSLYFRTLLLKHRARIFVAKVGRMLFGDV